MSARVSGSGANKRSKSVVWPAAGRIREPVLLLFGPLLGEFIKSEVTICLAAG